MTTDSVTMVEQPLLGDDLRDGKKAAIRGARGRCTQKQFSPRSSTPEMDTLRTTSTESDTHTPHWSSSESDELEVYQEDISTEDGEKSDKFKGDIHRLEEDAYCGNIVVPVDNELYGEPNYTHGGHVTAPSSYHYFPYPAGLRVKNTFVEFDAVMDTGSKVVRMRSWPMTQIDEFRMAVRTYENNSHEDTVQGSPAENTAAGADANPSKILVASPSCLSLAPAGCEAEDEDSRAHTSSGDESTTVSTQNHVSVAQHAAKWVKHPRIFYPQQGHTWVSHSQHAARHPPSGYYTQGNNGQWSEDAVAYAPPASSEAAFHNTTSPHHEPKPRHHNSNCHMVSGTTQAHGGVHTHGQRHGTTVKRSSYPALDAKFMLKNNRNGAYGRNTGQGHQGYAYQRERAYVLGHGGSRWYAVQSHGKVPYQGRTFGHFGQRAHAMPRFPTDACMRTSYHNAVDASQRDGGRWYSADWSSQQRAARLSAKAPSSEHQRAAAAEAAEAAEKPAKASSSERRVAPEKQAKASTERRASYNSSRHGTENKGKSTVMVRNIARRSTQKMLTSDLEEAGFAKQFNFIYLPFCFESKSNVGYAFINFLDGAIAERFIDEWNRKDCDSARTPIINGKKALTATYADVQGLDANIDRLVGDYKIARIHNPRYQPAIFEDGFRVNFHKYTERLAEKLQNNAAAKGAATCEKAKKTE